MTVLTLTFGWNAWASPLLVTVAICAGLHSRNMKASAAIAVTATTAKAMAQAGPELRAAGFVSGVGFSLIIAQTASNGMRSLKSMHGAGPALNYGSAGNERIHLVST